MIRTIAIAVASLTILGTAVAVDAGVTTSVAQRHSCGYHCTGDGSPATPAAPPIEQDANADGIIDGSIEQVGRANIHSGGRTGGFANKRVGCGGCKGHPASNVIEGGLWGIQPMMTDGFGRNRGTRPHHPRAACRCN